jgi:hypothetical protein
MDPTDRLKMIFGFVLLIGLLLLAGIFAMGKIEENTSFGLMPVVTTLSTLAGLFGGWAFREKRPDDVQPPPRVTDQPQPPSSSEPVKS